jgi:hypothetical protein
MKCFLEDLKFFGCIDLDSAFPGSRLLLGLGALHRDISIWLIEALSRTERLPNALKEADSDGSEAGCGSFNEA